MPIVFNVCDFECFCAYLGKNTFFHFGCSRYANLQANAGISTLDACNIKGFVMHSVSRSGRHAFYGMKLDSAPQEAHSTGCYARSSQLAKSAACI